MTDLNISVKQLKALVSPVLPLAGRDAGLPVLTAIRVESHGQYLTASATDRYRLGIKRLRADDGEWPEWSATIPTSTLRSILAAFKPSRRDADPELTLTIVSPDELRVVASGALLDMFGAEITYPLETAEFPKLHKLIRDALAADPAATAATGFNWPFLTDFNAAATGTAALMMRISAGTKPVVITDGEDFIGAVMPRKRFSSDGDTFHIGDGWDALLADAPEKKPAAKRAATRKPAARKTKVGAA